MVEFISYLRVSTSRQGESGLGLEAQQEAVSRCIASTSGVLFQEFREVETGKGRNALERRPVLREALELARKRKATLIIAKLDRLARNVAFISALMEGSVDFIAADNPYANRLTIHILAAVAEYEREMISVRTKSALAACKARGQKLGTYGAVLAIQNKAEALERLAPFVPALIELRAGKLSERKIAVELNARGLKSPGGGSWHKTSVHLALQRLSAVQAPLPQGV